MPAEDADLDHEFVPLLEESDLALAGEHQGDDQRHFDHRHGQCKHQGAIGLADALRDLVLLPSADGKDAALVANLPAGAYTAIVTGAANSSGTVLVEIYVLPP